MKLVRIVVSVLLFATAGVSYGTSVMENQPVISVKKFKRERYKHPVVLETGSDIEESQSSDFGPSAGGFRKNPMPWLYEDSDDTGTALTDQPDEKIYNDISKNMFIYNVAFLEALSPYKYRSSSRVLLAFDFDNNLVKVKNGAREIWNRISDITKVSGKNKLSDDWIHAIQTLTPKQAERVFEGTQKKDILKQLIRAMEKDQYVAIVTNNTDAHMIRAYLKYFAPNHYKKIPIVYRKFKECDGELKEVHLIMAHNRLVRYGRISRMILTDDLSVNIESAEQLGQSLEEVLVEAYQTNKRAHRHNLDQQAAENLKYILDLID